MNYGNIHPCHHANETRRLRDIISKVTRERDALQQQVYDLAARNAHLEKKASKDSDYYVEVFHNLHCEIDMLKAKAKANG